MCETYDIIEWKSCASLSSGTASSTDDHQNEANFHLGGLTLSRDGICSTNDIVFPKLFNENPESVISMADIDYYGEGPLDYWNKGENK
jgi:hypothetical protein